MLIKNLRTEWQGGAVVTDNITPRFTWELSSPVLADLQTSYQIQCGSTAGGSDLWDTTKTTSAMQRVTYAGATLGAKQRVFWRVRVWNSADVASQWVAAQFSIGLLNLAGWGSAQYVGFQLGGVGGSFGSPAVRKSITLPAKSVSNARLYATALGWYRPFINGQRVGQEEQSPGWTDYPTRRMYQTYDVTKLLVANATNAIALQLGDGQYLGKMSIIGRNYYASDIPRGMALLFVEYGDGTTDTFVTDSTWKGKATDCSSNDWYDGSRHDGRLSTVFSGAGIDESSWGSVTTLTPSTTAIMQAQPCEPIRRHDLLTAQARTSPSTGVYIFDLGQNHSGITTIRLDGQPSGQVVTVRHAEDLKANNDGTLYTANLRTAQATDRYTARGSAIEIFEPLHTYHGYRYVEITGYSGVPALTTVSSSPVSTNLKRVGHFACSNAIMNQIWSAMYWTDHSNSMSTFTDCNQRDERLGWDDSAHLCASTGMLMRDRQAYMRKYLQDHLDNISTRSNIDAIAPRVAVAQSNAAGWSDAPTEVAWALYLAYGDTEPLTAVVAAFKTKNLMAGLPWSNTYNDYLSPATDSNVLTFAWSYRTLTLLSKMATIIGDTAYATTTANRALDFINTWINWIDANSVITGDTQTGYLMGFTFGLIPTGKRAAALTRLVNNINTNGLNVGLLGVTLWYDVLADNGYLAMAYSLAQSTAPHSVAYPLTQGGTTMHEQWDTKSIEGLSIDPRGQVQAGAADNAHSMNHASRGPVCGWFMRTVAGIDIDPTQPGYANVIMRPRPDPSVTWASGEFDGPRGRIESKWRVTSKGMFWRVQIPANSKATLTIPPAYGTAKIAGANISTIGTATTADPITGGARWNMPSGTYDLALTV